ncbi:energy transducer TonB [Moraxella oblonga]|uniref:energy transducer TonB n=1 Tax=Moraxella oblonga TaxID=200413 RepID=UPI00082B00A3|nr:energy transducer TonB [Moraxella oblonga]
MKTYLLLMMGVLLAQTTWANSSYWQKPPNWNGLDGYSGVCYDIDMAYFNHNCKDTHINTAVQLTIDSQGNITHVSSPKTGNRSLDRQIIIALKNSKLKPFTPNGKAVAGTAKLPLILEIPTEKITPSRTDITHMRHQCLADTACDMDELEHALQKLHVQPNNRATPTP